LSDDTSAARADVSSGDRIAGYRLEEQIGQGGMAVVYRAHDERLDRRVALKVLAPGLTADTAFRTRFIRESRAAAAVDHPNIIPVYDAGDAGGFLFISMRYVQGGDVRSLLRDGHTPGPVRAWHIISQVASALDAAHSRGLVHRDVKPANILLDASSRTNAKSGQASGDPHDHVYLSDFGISKQTLASHLTSTGQFVGTLDYIAPEQVEGHAIDGRTDEYSLACAAFELLCGSPPFQRPTSLALITAHLTEPPPSLLARRAGLPASADAVLTKAMAKSPAQRYASCEQFATDLGRALGLLPGAVAAVTDRGAGSGAVAAGLQGADQQNPWPATELADPVPAAAAPGGSPGPAAAAFDASTLLGQQGGQPGAQHGAYQAKQPGRTWPEDPSRYGGHGQYGRPQLQEPTGNVQGWQQHPPARRPRRLLVGVGVTALVLAVAAAGATAAVVLGKKHGTPSPGHSSSPPASSLPASTAAAQATAISSLLEMSRASRGKLQPAVSEIENTCSSLTSSQLAADVATIRGVAMNRQSEYSQASNLHVAALANGVSLKNGLLDALRASLNADNDYLKWARQEQAGCSPASSSTAFNQAGTWDGRAVAAKTSFADQWNPVAQRYSLPAVNQADI
jgi:tRNA A-37 threonylcarbamoyl transferase component Bud32